MAYILDLDIDRCSACGACAVACMDQNDIEVGKDEPFRIVAALEEGKRFSYISVACQHCGDAPCVVACPSGCLRKDAETGLTLFDNTNCIGCHSCAMACPFGAPGFGEDGKMHKCDGCYVRLKNGLEPACVAVCPTYALRCLPQEDYQKLVIKNSLKRFSRKILDD